MIRKLFNAVFILLILTSFSVANEKIDQTIDKTTDFLKVGWRMVIMSTLIMIFAAILYWPFLES